MSRRHSVTALAIATATAASLLAVPANAAVVKQPITDFADEARFAINPIGSYDSGVFDESAAEIVAYYAATKTLLVINAQSGEIDLVSIADPTQPTKTGTVSAPGFGINSVAVRSDGLAVANLEPEDDKTKEGQMLFFNANNGEVLGQVRLGAGEHDAALPDMVGISADGAYAFSANEGEPAEDYSFDPEGSVSIVTLPPVGTLAAPTDADVRVAHFRDYNEGGTRTLPEGVRIFGQVGDSTTVAQNLEPEYITEYNGKLYTTLQENNAVAVVDIATATVENIFPLGTQDHLQIPLDASDRDGRINITTWPLLGIHQPDAIEAFQGADGNGYLVMANEGDARDWEAYSEEERLKNLGEDDLPGLCEGYRGLTADQIEHFQSDEGAGRIRVTSADGLNEDGTCYEQVYTFGSRSFSIFDTAGNEVFNSGAEFEQRLAEIIPDYFNSNHSESNFEGRSDDKGPEPEGVAVGTINDRVYAFIGLERIGGVMVYDVTTPAQSTYVGYVNNRDFSISMEDHEDDEAAIAANLPLAGDLGPEGLVFIPAADSPNRKNLLAVGNEVSGTTTIFEISGTATEAPADNDTGTGSSLSSDLSPASSVNPTVVAVAAIIGVLAALAGAVLTHLGVL